MLPGLSGRIVLHRDVCSRPEGNFSGHIVLCRAGSSSSPWDGSSGRVVQRRADGSRGTKACFSGRVVQRLADGSSGTKACFSCLGDRRGLKVHDGGVPSEVLVVLVVSH